MRDLVRHILRVLNPTVIERYEHKLMAGVVLAMAAFVPAVGIAAISLSAIGNEQNRLALFNHREAILSQDLQSLMQNEDRLRPLFILTGDPRFLDQLQQAEHAFDQLLTHLQTLEAPNSQAAKLLDRIEVLAQHRRALADPGITMRIEGEPIQSINHYFQQNNDHATSGLHRGVEAFQQLMRTQFEDFVTRQHRKLHTVGLTLLAADGFAVMVCAGIALLVFRLLQTKKAHDAALVQQVNWNSALATARKEAVETVAHDLRQPLQVMMFAAEKLQRAATDSQSIQTALDAFARSGTAMRRLIDTVLDPTAIETGSMPIVRKALDLHDILGDVFSRFRLTAAAADVDLIYVPLSEALPLQADAARLDQVVSNLLANAIKFTPAGGSVILTTAYVAPWVTITVSDTGCGMSRDQVEQVFSRYWRGGTAPEHGSGLGLAISKIIVDAHGGHIDVNSMPGHGSSFKVHLPIDPPALLAQAGQPVAIAEDHPTELPVPQPC